MIESPGKDLPSDDPPDAGSGVTPEDGKRYNLGTPHGLVIPQTALPKLSIDYTQLLPELAKLRAVVLAPLEKVFEDFRAQWAPFFEQWTQSITDLTELAIQLLPPNWEETTKPDWEIIESILLDEGIPLAWIPRREILQALFDAKDAAARRRILSRRWQIIVADCDQLLDGISHRQLADHGRLAKRASQALNAGYAEASQALSANLLDSVLGRHFEDAMRKAVTNHKDGNRLDMDEFGARAGLVLAPVWRGHAHFWRDKGDPVPYAFTRHASAHAVSRRQYSRVNAVIALMLVTSVLKLLDDTWG